MSEKEELYHERQTLYRCGLHALNNVLQGPVFSKASLDDACVELAALADPNAGSGFMNWAWNPHRAPLGLGNYDVNALTLVLQQKGYVMQWIDKRQPVNENLFNLDEAEGVLCNVVMTTILSSLWTQRHWFAIRKIRGVCYNLDSKLEAPVAFESESACFQFLQELVNTGECELFLITREKNTNTEEESQT
ncbi:Josephin [Phytophthora infestans]|uniref:ubiquitinyl hydrolase 1 n=1 Tax=Phytophthora infestans TaxID=4787 RepID=A0A833TM20_PHYIN|nr:Josephin [Phytophthora infestans]KAF4135932.1 Josephin [Phytophthora infestans]